MKQCFALILIFAGSVVMATANGNKIILLVKSNEAIIIDGKIDPAWSYADSSSDFFQLSPYYGKPPSDRTVVKMLTSEKSLYCLFKCYQKKEEIQQNTGKLDDVSGDLVSLMIDTFGDNRTAYKFGVSASGVKNDSRLLDDARNRDYSWDGIWFASAKIYDWGYVVEIEVPYKSIQYDNHLKEWGLDFDRWIANKTEDLYWCQYEENEGQRISKFGKLVFEEFQPSVRGYHLEIYPVGISKATYLQGNKYDVNPDAGIDLYYNPSAKLTFQFTANPDFAQIEADPFEFNISRYETYYDERRPFFIEGSEIFNASGRQRNTGFYKPLELFYSRRIGKKLPDGKEVPLLTGAKAFGRINQWEYGSFLAVTGATNYTDDDGIHQTEERAVFGSARLTRQIFGNSSMGVLFVGKHSASNDNGVLDIDGALRTSSWQLAYQLAQSYNNSEIDFGGSMGFTMFKENWINMIRGRYIGDKFDINQVGYVPWQGTGEFVALTGPRWYFDKGYIKQILIYFGPLLSYEKVDRFTDYGGVFGFNMQFRNNWGYEINIDGGKAKDQGKKFTFYESNLSSWFNVSPRWHANIWGGYSRSYNFSRDYLAFYSWFGGSIQWLAADILQIGTSVDTFIEGNPSGGTEDITFNTRPFFSATPINNLNIRVYVDNVFVRSTGKLQQLISGFLFSYNFSPKSWIYFAINEVRDRSDRYDSQGNLLPNQLHIVDRAGVFKVKYLYYF